VSETTGLTGRQILDIPMGQNDSGADTIRGYLVALVARVWDEGEGFSGKRPFGNSSWECELFEALIEAGAVPNGRDKWGDITVDAEDAARPLIQRAIDALRDGTGS
jgi:hypothetical protein